jgi:sulfide:quinone oxidoreductase
MRILVLGAGFGGLELATSLSEEFGEELEIVLIDKNEGFVFGFSKLDVMFGRKLPNDVVHPYRDLDKPGLRFVRATIHSIDPVAKHVETEAGHEFYTVPGAFALRDELARFDGGDVIVGVTSTPFKCPPAPSETALLMHDFLTQRGVRAGSSISLVMPLGVPIPPSPAASEALLVAFAERGISWYPERLVSRLDPARKVAVFSDGAEMPFDLFLGVPVHRAPAVVEESGLTVDGWVPVDPLTLETRFEGIYAVGDVTSVGTPKAGVFAEGQASVVAGQIASTLRVGSSPATYDGRGVCYLEFGHDQVARVSVTFLSGAAPAGELEGPSSEIAADKGAFGSSRIQRWFDRAWS